MSEIEDVVAKREWVELTDDESHDLQVYPLVVIVVLIGYLIGFIL
jgi:hypothetical protein